MSRTSGHGRLSRAGGLAAALLVPGAITLAVAYFELPPFAFEHAIVLLVVAFAVRSGLGISMLAVLSAVLLDNVILREPLGRPTITGARDVFDLVLFSAVAVVVSSLVAQVRDEHAQAAAAADRERQAREARDRLIATVSHDLATPLAVLAGTLQMLREGRAVDTDRLLARLETATTRAQSLVRTLADAQALESDGLNLRMAPVDLHELVPPIVQMLDTFSDRHSVMLSAPDAPLVVLADGARIQSVLENLVNNAIKYSPEGGTVEVTLRNDGGRATIDVRDYGIGISPEARPHVFEAAFRASEAVTIAPGLGLGLNIAAQIVKQHGGTIDIRPADGKGTVVSIGLPLAADHRVAGTPSASRTVKT